MAYFINGGNSGANTPYVGATVGDATATLNFLRTEILGSGEGWVIGDVDDIGGSGQFSVDSTGTANNKIRILFTRGVRATSGFSDEYIHIRVRDLDASGTLTSAILTSYSPNDYHRLQVASVGSNLVYAAIYEDSMNIMTIPSSGFANGIHVGMLERLDDTDRTAIYIGYTVHHGSCSNDDTTASSSVTSGWSRCYSAVSPANSSQWVRVGAYFADAPEQRYNETTNSGSNQIAGADLVAVGTVYPDSSFFSSPAQDNPNYQGHLGRVNSYQGKPILFPYYIIEGKNPQSNVQWASSQECYCKGIVRDVVSGMNYMTAGGQWEDNTGKVFINTGGAGHLSFRIA